jgi:homogentisate 1,2-dioxygenase
MNLIAVDNKIYYSVYQVNEDKKEQLVQDLDGNHIVFRIDDGNMEVTQDVLEINVSLAHF